MTRFVGTPLRGTEFSAPSDEAVSARVAGDTIPRFRIDAGGRITWGDGTAAGDVKLYRATTGAIVTDGYFSASGGLQTSAISASPTVSLPNGALIVDNGSNSLYFRANDQWIAAGAGQGGNASLTVSDTPPADPASGDLWFESDSGKTFVYYDSFWIEVGSGGSSTNAESLVGLSDVAFSTLGNGDFFKYNSSASVWTNDPINLGTDTVGNYLVDLTQGTGVSISHTPGEGSTATISLTGGPAFSAYPATSQTISSGGTLVKILFGTEEFDTGSCFSSSRFTPTVAGYYQINSTVRLDGGGPGTGECMIVIFKNGGEAKRGWNSSGASFANDFFSMSVSGLVYCNGTTDYIEIYAQQVSGGNRTTSAFGNISYFQGHLARYA
ncbi:hypothetical protein UFOVP658_176 [uncultured Caudovirales phage]|uniref:C1q domain containing protein n=1 Tax=uncultured Caudovirales phage TaxID=2100421 RepID=A0A6J5NI04_9CAUD|nr:hypothetical protein UFOVP658_176 [uncultured Caudovirales phage]